jgi:glucose/mannose-6-phosphate isomerase
VTVSSNGAPSDRRGRDALGVDLDDLDALAALDSENVLGAVEDFPEQCRRAWGIGRGATNLPDATDVDSVVVLGMGGSGVSGDVVGSVVEPRLPVPLRTIKGYGPLPEWIGRNTLLFAVSYSGQTEETLAAIEQGHERGARAVAVSSGGSLAELAGRNGIAHVGIPVGLQPRSSLGYLALPILAVLEKVGLVPALEDDVDEAVAVLGGIAARCDRKQPSETNPAKSLALALRGRLPVVYGSEGLTATAAYRFKCDLNEYAKTPAHWHYFPELDHNEIVGYEDASGASASNFAIVLLRDVDEHPRISLRITATRALIEPQVAELVEVRAQGRSPLTRILSLILVTQLAAIYLGLSYGVDPGPVELIQRLKAELSRR